MLRFLRKGTALAVPFRAAKLGGLQPLRESPQRLKPLERTCYCGTVETVPLRPQVVTKRWEA